MNYFELLNIKTSYDIDIKELQKNYYLLQTKYHPDKCKDPKEKYEYSKISANINKAYNVLKCDTLRAEYLLSLNNINIDSVVNIDLLQEVLEEQESLDNTKLLQDLLLFRDNKILAKKTLIQKLELYFKSNNFSEAFEVLIRLKYINKLINSCEVKLKNANN